MIWQQIEWLSEISHENNSSCIRSIIFLFHRPTLMHTLGLKKKVNIKITTLKTYRKQIQGERGKKGERKKERKKKICVIQLISLKTTEKSTKKRKIKCVNLISKQQRRQRERKREPAMKWNEKKFNESSTHGGENDCNKNTHNYQGKSQRLRHRKKEKIKKEKKLWSWHIIKI